MGSSKLAAARRILPRATLAAGLFHVVQLAVKAVRDARRRVAHARYGRRGRAGDPEYGIKGLLAEPGAPVSGQFAKITGTLDRDRYRAGHRRRLDCQRKAA
jgi:hypothetical protein